MKNFLASSSLPPMPDSGREEYERVKEIRCILETIGNTFMDLQVRTIQVETQDLRRIRDTLIVDITLRPAIHSRGLLVRLHRLLAAIPNDWLSWFMSADHTHWLAFACEVPAVRRLFNRLSGTHDHTVPEALRILDGWLLEDKEI